MKNINIVKKFIFIVELILMFVIQQNAFFSPQVFGVRPVLIIPAFVSIGAFMDEKEAMWLGLLAGLLLDMSVGNAFGIHLFLLFVVGYTIGFLSEHIIDINLISTTILSFITALFVIIMRFLLFYVCKGYSDAMYAFFKHYFPCVVYTALITPITYLFNRAVSYFGLKKGGV